jgi:hypothetical protein
MQYRMHRQKLSLSNSSRRSCARAERTKCILEAEMTLYKVNVLRLITWWRHGDSSALTKRKVRNSIHFTRIARVHTDYPCSPLECTRYQAFTCRLRQEEGKAGLQCALQPVSESHGMLVSPTKEPAVIIHAQELRPHTKAAPVELNSPYARTYKRSRARMGTAVGL